MEVLAPITDIDAARRIVADEFEQLIEPDLEEMVRLWREEIPEFAAIDQPETWDGFRRITRVTRRQQAAAVRTGRVPTEMPHDAETVRLGIASGLSREAVFRSYQLAGGVSWQAFMRATQAVAVEPGLRASLFDEVSRLVRAYEERLMAEVSAACDRELARPSARSDRDRLHGVQRLLDGLTDELIGYEYPLAETHLGLIVWGPESREAIAAVRRGISHRAAAEVHRIDGRGLQVWWLWLAISSDREELGRAIGRLEAPGDSRIAVGEPGEGLDGFRATHRQAGGAYVVAERTGDRVARYRDVALEVLILGAEREANELTTAELGPPGGRLHDPKLLETLRVYFEVGQNAASAAVRLGCSEVTVARRLRTVAEAIGSPVQQRRTQLEIALRTLALGQSDAAATLRLA